MFPLLTIVGLYLFAFIAMFCMDGVYKAAMFLVLLLIFTFIVFLFIEYSMQSAMFVLCFITLFAFTRKD